MDSFTRMPTLEEDLSKHFNIAKYEEGGDWKFVDRLFAFLANETTLLHTGAGVTKVQELAKKHVEVATKKRKAEQEEKKDQERKKELEKKKKEEESGQKKKRQETSTKQKDEEKKKTKENDGASKKQKKNSAR